MNHFAWNITFNWNKSINWIDFDYVESLWKSWDKTIFVFWETNLSSSKDIVKYFEDKFWNLKNHDISISTEDKIEIIWESYEEWLYELASFEWEQVDFNEIVDRFKDVLEVVSIREAEVSNKFWNKIVKVDFVY